MRLIRASAIARFFGASRSTAYKKIFVSRNALTLIHLFPRELASGPHSRSGKIAHQRLVFPQTAIPRGIVRQPLPKSLVESSVLLARDLAGLFDQLFLG